MATITASDPGFDIVTITPSDVADLAVPVRALRANAAGTIKVSMPGNGVRVDRTLNFLAGETRVGVFLKVFATGTSATGIEGHT